MPELTLPMDGPCIYLQDEFGTCVLEGPDGQSVTRIISLPSFEKTKQAVLVNLRTLEAHPMHFPGLVEYEGESSN